VARKQLGEFTKNLKRALKSAEDELLSSSNGGSIATLATETKSTIKHYQSEIDALTRRCKLAETTFLQLYHSLYECCCFDDVDDLSIVFEQAIQLLTSKDDQLNNLLRGMEELNDELEMGNEEKMQLRGELKEVERQLNEALKKGGGAKKSDGGIADGNEGGALSLAEREELIRLRSEVAEYEVEFRGLKNQDITIRKLESEFTFTSLSVSSVGMVCQLYFLPLILFSINTPSPSYLQAKLKNWNRTGRRKFRRS